MTLKTGAAGWRQGFETLEIEHADPIEPVVVGTIQPDLDGTLFRIGPARHEIFDERNGSWFDGDGMVHAFRFAGGRVSYRNRFVQTQKMRDESAAGHRLYGGFGTRSPVDGLKRIRGLKSVAGNPANTHIVAHAGALLALCEGGQPYRIDPVTLATLGDDDLGAIPDGETFLAHAKQDPATGELWNIGFRRSPPIEVSVYRRDVLGRTHVAARHKMPLNALAHDFALTPTKVVIVVAPLVMPALPLGLLSHQSFLSLLEWRPRLGTHFLIIDRATGDVHHAKTDAFLLHHTVNAFDEGDDVILDLCAYPDASVFDLFREPLAGNWPEIRNASPERFRLAPTGRVERKRLADVAFEFPRVAPRSWLSRHRFIYGVCGYLGEPIRLDTETGDVDHFWRQPNEFAGELVPVPKPGGTTDADVWLLGLVLDASGKTELRIFDGANPAAAPVARVRLPYAVPFDFHGNWLPTNGSATLP